MKGATMEFDTITTAEGDLGIRFLGHSSLIFFWAGKTIHVDLSLIHISEPTRPY